MNVATNKIEFTKLDQALDNFMKVFVNPRENELSPAVNLLLRSLQDLIFQIIYIMSQIKSKVIRCCTEIVPSHVRSIFNSNRVIFIGLEFEQTSRLCAAVHHFDIPKNYAVAPSQATPYFSFFSHTQLLLNNMFSTYERSGFLELFFKLKSPAFSYSLSFQFPFFLRLSKSFENLQL